MDSTKLEYMARRLFHYEVGPFLIGVSSGQICPVTDSNEWAELKKKAQSNRASDNDVRRMVEMSQHSELGRVYELFDSLK